MGEGEEKLPYLAGDKSQREEHGHGGQRGADDSGADFLCAPDGRRAAGFTGLHVAVGVFQHDDAVVHDAADGDGEAGEAHKVEGPVKHRHHDHGNHDAERYGDGDN